MSDKVGQNGTNNGQQHRTKEQQNGSVGGGGVSFQFSPVQERMEQLLRQPRSEEYLAVFQMLDYLSQNDQDVIARLRADMDEELADAIEEMSDEELLEAIRANFLEEFQALTIEQEDELIGVVSRCYINGCDIHAIDNQGNILQHFEVRKELDPEFERARTIYHKIGGKCACIEVYRRSCAVVAPDGSVEIFRN